MTQDDGPRSRLKDPERWPFGAVVFTLLLLVTLAFLCGLGIGLTA